MPAPPSPAQGQELRPTSKSAVPDSHLAQSVPGGTPEQGVREGSGRWGSLRSFLFTTWVECFKLKKKKKYKIFEEENSFSNKTMFPEEISPVVSVSM